MFEVALHSPQTDTVDWRELADEVFPADALRTTRQRTIQFQWAQMGSDASA
jgi:hypothetical protein